MKHVFLVLLVFVSFFSSGSDSTKVCMALRTGSAPRIDGLLDEENWSKTAPVKDFVMNRPLEGGVPTHLSEVRIMYDNYAVYVGAILYDTHPDSILHELGNRDDDNLNADFFRFVIDPYNKRQDAFDFGVSAAGVQAD